MSWYSFKTKYALRICQSEGKKPTAFDISTLHEDPPNVPFYRSASAATSTRTSHGIQRYQIKLTLVREASRLTYVLCKRILTASKLEKGNLCKAIFRIIMRSQTLGTHVASPRHVIGHGIHFYLDEITDWAGRTFFHRVVQASPICRWRFKTFSLERMTSQRARCIVL